MKNTKIMAICTLLVTLCAGIVNAQSLGDYARAARKNKVEPNSASRHFDNDNLPTNDGLSVVGQPPAADASAAATTNAGQAAKPAVSDPTAAADRQQAQDEWKRKIDKQKEKIDSLTHELDLQQREYRLRMASFYADEGNRLRNAADMEKEGTQYKSDVEEKQKTIDADKQELENMQEQARKAGVVEKDTSKDTDKDKK
jgi:hypothetical protein